MKSFLSFLIKDLEALLAGLLVIGGILLMPAVNAANTADVQLNARVLGTDQCNNGLDDDGDGEIDHPDDPGCTDYYDTDESDAAQSGSTGQSSSSAPSIPPTTPSIPNPITVPLPDTPIVIPPAAPAPIPDQVEGFYFYEYAPRMFDVGKNNIITFYGRNLEEGAQAVFNVQGNSYITGLHLSARNLPTFNGPVDAYAAEIPAKALPVGKGVVTLVRDGVRISPPLKMWMRESLSIDRKRAQVLNSPIRLTLKSGEARAIGVNIKNTSSVQWDEYWQPMHVGTSSPFDRDSQFVHKSWRYSNRPMKVILAQPVPVGKSVQLNLTIQAPQVTKTKRITEKFSLVMDGWTWLNGSEFTIDATVNPTTQAQSVSRAQNLPITTAVVKVQQRLKDILIPPTQAAEKPKSYYQNTVKPGFWNRLLQVLVTSFR